MCADREIARRQDAALLRKMLERDGKIVVSLPGRRLEITDLRDMLAA